MDRRASIKSLMIGAMAGGAALSGCKENPEIPGYVPEEIIGPYGRTEAEKLIDQKLLSEHFLTDHELETLTTLCDLILPAGDGYPSAGEVDVVGFIAFMSKDMPALQLPLRGGVMWIDTFSMSSYNKEFINLTRNQMKSIADQIAYPEDVDPALSQGAAFFSLVRNLTLTGFYTTKVGIEELEYKGNSPNVWDGVPEEILKEHGMAYDPEWLSKCIDQKTRDKTAQWDDNGKLIT